MLFTYVFRILWDNNLKEHLLATQQDVTIFIQFLC